MIKRLAIITTHPIQYNAPWFRMLAERNKIHVKVFYTWSQVQNEKKFDPGFGKNIDWDIPLLEGYDYIFVNNVSKNPGSKTFNGIQNPTLIKEIEGWKADAVLVFGWKFKSHLKAIKYFHNKISVLFRGDTTLLDEPSGIKRILRNRILKNVYKNVDYALCVGTENKKFYENIRLREDQLLFAPHAIDNARFRKTGTNVNLRVKLNIADDEIVFLFAGKLETKKNPNLLASAFVKGNFEKSHLVFVGNGPLENDLKEKYEGIHIHFLDFQNQQVMPSVYRMANVFVLPSQGPGETWGLAVNEAMACSKPVLVSDKCGCAKDLVENGVTGYVFRSNDESDLMAKMKLMISQKDVLQNMGKSAFERIQEWSFEKIATTIENLVNNETN